MKLGNSRLEVPVIAVGCMRINSIEAGAAERYIQTALEAGANFFDHADIYGQGACEEIFAEAVHMSPAVRETIIIQSKCGIVPGRMFDFSKEYIMRSAEDILKRLKTEYLDLLLLHRPDALMEPEEVAYAFEALESSGKVRHFGVSNQNPMQIQLLQKYVKQPILVNQLQFSITNSGMISSGIHVNMEDAAAVDRDGGVLDFCRLHDITIQPWSPFQYGFFGGTFLGSDKYPELNELLDQLALQYGVTKTTIAISWILRHPARMMPVVGTTNPQRLLDCCKAAEIDITREEWYAIYKSAGNQLP